MHLILIIAAGILLAYFLLPLLGPIAPIFLGVLVIAGIIFGIWATVASVLRAKESLENFREKDKRMAEEHRRWLESLPEEQRIIEQRKDKKRDKIAKAIGYICIGVIIFCIVLFILLIVAPEAILSII